MRQPVALKLTENVIPAEIPLHVLRGGSPTCRDFNNLTQCGERPRLAV